VVDDDLAEDLRAEEEREYASYEAWLRDEEFNDGSSRPICQPRLRMDPDGTFRWPKAWKKEHLAFELWRLQNRVAFLLAEEYGEAEAGGEPPDVSHISQEEWEGPAASQFHQDDDPDFSSAPPVGSAEWHAWARAWDDRVADALANLPDDVPKATLALGLGAASAEEKRYLTDAMTRLRSHGRVVMTGARSKAVYRLSSKEKCAREAAKGD
jgi:hypothetical protein